MTVEAERTGEPSRRPLGAAHTRGFLFADIRGYTEYVERHGAEAAAGLLARYRNVVRSAIAAHAGAEIRTEGDSFYVVLPSASGAVLCAISILDELDADNARQPDDPIGAGIGVHAGEAIDTAEGLVGSAVNIAARLAALARPGEILVSETVRALTRSVVPVTYAPRGRHRLKGVAEPQEVLAVLRSSGAAVGVRAARRFPAAVAGTAAVVGLALVLALVYVALPSGGAPPATATPSRPALQPTQTVGLSPTTAAEATSSTPSSVSPSPAASGPDMIFVDPELNPALAGPPPLTAGSWRFNSFRPIVQLEIETAWSDRQWHPILAGSDHAQLYGIRAFTDSTWYPPLGIKPGMVVLTFVRLQTVLGNPCDPGDTTSYELLGGRPRDVIDWLSSHRFLEASNLQPAAAGGYTGLALDVAVTGDPGKACAGSEVPGQGRANLFKTTPSASGYSGIFSLKDGEEARFIVLDIGGDAPLVLISSCRAADCESVQPWAQDLIDTLTVLTD